MKIIIVGGTGTLGSMLATKLQQQNEHQIVVVGNNSGDFQVDIGSTESVQQLFQQIGSFDALVATTGKANFSPLTTITPDDYSLGFNNKLMGQIRLVIEGLKHINPGGSFTLTSGLLDEQPVLGSSSVSTVNGALKAFVHSCALELPAGLRINLVSPSVVTESLATYGEFFKGYQSVDAETVANAYIKSIFGIHNGSVYKLYQ